MDTWIDGTPLDDAQEAADAEALAHAQYEAELAHWRSVLTAQLLSEGWRPPENEVERSARKLTEQLALSALPF